MCALLFPSACLLLFPVPPDWCVLCPRHCTGASFVPALPYGSCSCCAALPYGSCSRMFPTVCFLLFPMPCFFLLFPMPCFFLLSPVPPSCGPSFSLLFFFFVVSFVPTPPMALALVVRPFSSSFSFCRLLLAALPCYVISRGDGRFVLLRDLPR